MLSRHIALISDTSAVSFADIAHVSTALQKQAMRDLGPIWDVRATVDPIASLERMPLGYWPIIIVDDVEDAGGYHTDQNGQPYALVEAGDTWSLTASHECLEMLVDPFGSRLVAGASIMPGQGRVRYLAEVCDPSESEAFAYTVNDVLVSDFYTQHFFDPVATTGQRYSFTGAITAPRQVLPGGYLSWHDLRTDHWWQQVYFNAVPKFLDLGILPKDGRSIREMIDMLSPGVNRLSKLPNDNPVVKELMRRRAETSQICNANAAAIRSHIASLMLKK